MGTQPLEAPHDLVMSLWPQHSEGPHPSQDLRSLFPRIPGFCLTSSFCLYKSRSVQSPVLITEQLNVPTSSRPYLEQQLDPGTHCSPFKPGQPDQKDLKPPPLRILSSFSSVVMFKAKTVSWATALCAFVTPSATLSSRPKTSHCFCTNLMSHSQGLLITGIFKVMLLMFRFLMV